MAALYILVRMGHCQTDGDLGIGQKREQNNNQFVKRDDSAS